MKIETMNLEILNVLEAYMQVEIKIMVPLFLSSLDKSRTIEALLKVKVKSS
jgi:hypothetical protein